MIDTILDSLGLVKKSRVEKEINKLKTIVDVFRDEFWKKENKEVKLLRENMNLKDKIRKLEKEIDVLDFDKSLVNNNLIKKDNEIKKLEERIKWLNYENNYYRNRSKYIAVNNNISFEACEILEDKKIDKKIDKKVDK
jgi:predicted nuclease with TOPRIM domain